MSYPQEQQTATCFDLAVEAERTHAPLSECVEVALKTYFKHLDGHSAANLYEMLLSEVEAPLLRATLEHTQGNQSRAAEILGLNRGTLRKKLKAYGL
ncbi:MAG: DNA-binding transcriptional regulator Fis [Gammaproteobacteria bacterium]|nr:DNA-binding transcriptional regulator Fis [Gammaproteobacteria bacterium]